MIFIYHSYEYSELAKLICKFQSMFRCSICQNIWTDFKAMTEIQAVSGEQTLKRFSVKTLRFHKKKQLFNVLEGFQKLFLAIIFGVRIFRVFEILEKYRKSKISRL